MRVENRTAIASQRAQAARPAGVRFEVGGTQDSGATAAVRHSAGLTGIESLLLLQGEEDPVLGRRRAAKRGQSILDALERLKVAMLSGAVRKDDLERIRAELAQRREATSDPGLDEVIAQIELRAAVELAKLGQAS